MIFLKLVNYTEIKFLKKMDLTKFDIKKINK